MMVDVNNTTLISIGELAKRSGIAASALRFYESRGLITSVRSPAQRRHFPREVLRRVAFIKAAQTAGLTLEEIENSLASLPGQRTPTKQDWERLSRSWHSLIEERIRALTTLRDQLSSCIGCGCLSLKSCALYNPQDIANTRGTGPRYLMGDKSSDLV